MFKEPSKNKVNNQVPKYTSKSAMCKNRKISFAIQNKC